MPVVCCQVAEQLLDAGGDNPSDGRPALRWLDISATTNPNVHAPHRAWVQQVAQEMVSSRERNTKKANRRGSTKLKEEARGVAITAWLLEQAEVAKLAAAAEATVMEAALAAKAEAEAAKVEWVAKTTKAASLRVSYSLKRRSRAGWHDDKEAVLGAKAAYLKAEAEATVQDEATLAAAAESIGGEGALVEEPLQGSAELVRTQPGPTANLILGSSTSRDSFGLGAVSRAGTTTATTPVVSRVVATLYAERERSLTDSAVPPAEEGRAEGRGRALTVTTAGVAKAGAVTAGAVTAGGGTSAARILRSLQWREQAWRAFTGSSAEDNGTASDGAAGGAVDEGDASAVGGGERRAIRARGGIRAGRRRGSLSDGGDSDGEGGGGGGGAEHTAQRASARHGSEVWSDDDGGEGVWEGGRLLSTTWHGPERRAFEARRKQLLARFGEDGDLTSSGGPQERDRNISGAEDSNRERDSAMSGAEGSGRARDRSISGADSGRGLAGPESLKRLLTPPPKRGSRARRPSVERHPKLAAALSTREDSIAAQIPAWQHLPFGQTAGHTLASASAVNLLLDERARVERGLAPLRTKSTAARTQKIKLPGKNEY